MANKKKWELLSQKSPQIIDSVIQLLLNNRGMQTEDDKRNFLHPDIENVTSEGIGIDKNELKKAYKRVVQAIDKKEHVVVFGDYDVDGITGSAILWESLRDLGVEVMPYIPDRVEEGYGLSITSIANLLLQIKDVKLIITVDNGIVANEAVEFAKEKGIDVIITDHHVPQDDTSNSLPDAFSIIHTTRLCGAGVAWVFSKELRKYLNRENKTLNDSHLELTTLGTIADLVPLKDSNRTIVYHGLKNLQKTIRPGLIALCQEAGITQEKIGVYEIGFLLAPRLNAAGRLGNAMDSLRLLCTINSEKASSLAVKLSLINKERQRVMFEAAKHASSVVRSRATIKKLLVVADESYQEGVIGLMAGKLVEEYYRPAIVIAKSQSVSKGSVRSIPGFDIISFLRSNSKFFVNIGGHPMAAGFTIETDRIKEFSRTFEQLAEKAVLDEHLKRTLLIDCELEFSLITPELYQRVQELSPFGIKNPQPLFVSRNIVIRSMKLLGKEGNHLRLVLEDENSGKIYEAVAFNMGELIYQFLVEDKIDVVYAIELNTWKGETKLQFKVKDIKKN